MVIGYMSAINGKASSSGNVVMPICILAVIGMLHSSSGT